MKPSELTGQKLDRIVHDLAHHEEPIKDGCLAPPYSSDWCFGGPIIEREGIELCRLESSSFGIEWRGQIDCDCRYYGPTPLIAAMRVYVASKLGDEVEIPEELAVAA
jgi:hypothetical protein